MRAAALTLLVFILALSLLSAVFFSTLAGHEHDHNGAGGGCSVCAQIHNAQKLPLGAAVAVISLVCLFAAAPLFSSFTAGLDTPVNLKIRFNN